MLIHVFFCPNFLHIIYFNHIHTRRHSNWSLRYPQVLVGGWLWFVLAGGIGTAVNTHGHTHIHIPQVGTALQRLFEQRKRRIFPLIPTIPLASFSKYPTASRLPAVLSLTSLSMIEM